MNLASKNRNKMKCKFNQGYCRQECGKSRVHVQKHDRTKKGKVEHVHEYCRAKWGTKK